MRRRTPVSFVASSVAASLSKIVMRPRVGFSDSSISRSSVVLPAPEGPVRNWKLCGAISNVASRMISAPIP